MTEATVESPHGFDHINKPLFAITGGFIALFCVSALVDLEGLSGLVEHAPFPHELPDCDADDWSYPPLPETDR